MWVWGGVAGKGNVYGYGVDGVDRYDRSDSFDGFDGLTNDRCSADGYEGEQRQITPIRTVSEKFLSR